MNRPREEFEAIARAFSLGDAVGARSGSGFLPQALCQATSLALMSGATTRRDQDCATAAAEDRALLLHILPHAAQSRDSHQAKHRLVKQRLTEIPSREELQSTTR